MLHIILFEPEIPPNTGNIIRLCANAGMQLHLIEPFGFELDDKRMRRAGLDYHEWAHIKTHASYQAFTENTNIERIFACTTKARQHHTEVQFEAGDGLLMGPETRGLPDHILNSCGPDGMLRIPMLPESRSLNLSNATAIIAYEALRQLNFPGCV